MRFDYMQSVTKDNHTTRPDKRSLIAYDQKQIKAQRISVLESLGIIRRFQLINLS